MRVVFFGSSEYSQPILESLRQNFDLILVVTRPDKPIGRKQIMTPSPVKVWAEKNRIPVAEKLNDVKCDLAIVADFGRIIPPEEFNLPKLGTFNIHFSKLPDLRGASPVQQTLLRGDTTAWITIIRIEKTLDTGPILDQRSFPIYPNDTAQTLYTRLFAEAAKYLPTLDFTKKLTTQSGTPTFCGMLTKQNGFVEWEEIKNEKYKIKNLNRYRAMTPWPGLWSLHPSGKRVKILKCHLGNNQLVLDEIQFEGKNPQTYRNT